MASRFSWINIVEVTFKVYIISFTYSGLPIPYHLREFAQIYNVNIFLNVRDMVLGRYYLGGFIEEDNYLKLNLNDSFECLRLLIVLLMCSVGHCI